MNILVLNKFLCSSSSLLGTSVCLTRKFWAELGCGSEVEQQVLCVDVLKHLHVWTSLYPPVTDFIKNRSVCWDVSPKIYRLQSTNYSVNLPGCRSDPPSLLCGRSAFWCHFVCKPSERCQLNTNAHRYVDCELYLPWEFLWLNSTVQKVCKAFQTGGKERRKA